MAVDGGARYAELSGDPGDGVGSPPIVAQRFVHLLGDPGLAGAGLGPLSPGTVPGPVGGQAVTGALGRKGVLELSDGTEDL